MTTDKIKQCRYYKGEEKCPFGEGGDKAMFWFYEKNWLERQERDDSFFLGSILGRYEQCGLTDFEKEDGVPITLKAILFNRYEQWFEGGPGDFKYWYKERYIEGSR